MLSQFLVPSSITNMKFLVTTTNSKFFESRFPRRSGTESWLHIFSLSRLLLVVSPPACLRPPLSMAWSPIPTEPWFQVCLYKSFLSSHNNPLLHSWWARSCRCPGRSSLRQGCRGSRRLCCPRSSGCPRRLCSRPHRHWIRRAPQPEHPAGGSPQRRCCPRYAWLNSHLAI